MNKSLSKILITAVTIFAFTISSCKKHDDHNIDHDGHKMLNISYPAAYVVNGASNNLSVLKLSDNTVSETIGLNGATFPHHIYINPVKNKLAVAITATDLLIGA